MAEVDKATAQRAIRNILDSRREFQYEDEDANIRSYFIGSPTGEDVRKADWNYAKVFNQAIDDGFPTQAQMLETLQKRGILSEDYARNVEKVKINLAAALFRLENMSDGMEDIDKEALALEVARLRDELFTLNQKINSPMGSTCENMAEDARIEYLTSRIIQNKEGKRVWQVYDDYLTEANTRMVMKARFEVMLYLQGLDSGFLENTPERKALRDLAEKRLNEVMNAPPTPETDEVALESQVEDIVLPDDPKPKKRGRAKKSE